MTVSCLKFVLHAMSEDVAHDGGMPGIIPEDVLLNVAADGDVPETVAHNGMMFLMVSYQNVLCQRMCFFFF